MVMSENNLIRVGVLTVSDRCYQGVRDDFSGPVLLEAVIKLGWMVISTDVVPDELDKISSMLRNWVDSHTVDLILTTGGTGFAPRDVTPEATTLVIERNAPGLSEAIRAESLKITPHAMLSRAVAGICKSTLIVNLPGSPNAALESLSVIASVIPHAIELLRKNPDAECGHHYFGKNQDRAL